MHSCLRACSSPVVLKIDKFRPFGVKNAKVFICKIVFFNDLDVSELHVQQVIQDVGLIC